MPAHRLFSRMHPCVLLLCLLLAACSGDTPPTTTAQPALKPPAPVLSGGVALFSGARSNYILTPNGSQMLVTDLTGKNAPFLLDSSVTLVQFDDVSVNLRIGGQAHTLADTDLNALIELYIAYFNRVPDANGLSYWIDRLQGGMSLAQIGESFYAAALQFSSLTGYSSSMSNTEFVRIVYKNVLGRSVPDQAGLDYWTAQLDAGTATRGTLIKTMLNAAHGLSGDAEFGWVAQLLDNKTSIGKQFAVQQGLSYIKDEDSIARGMALAATISATDTSIAQNLIQAVVGWIPVGTTPPGTTEASRFLMQATFGTTASDLAILSSIGYASWLDSQFNRSQTLHRTYMDNIAATLAKGVSGLSQNNFFESFWQQAILGDDALRQRVTYALSQIFVISFQDGTVANFPRGVAGYYDTLATHAFGNYRTLLEAVTLHPMMGIYLTSIHNQKESGTRVPDENYAREVMQLFSIGLYQLNQDGSPQLANGRPIETYTNADITGLAKVFTGWSWAGPDQSDTRFFGGNADPNRDWLPMQSYPKYHSTSEKAFLGVRIPAQGTADPVASLKIALDTLFNHPNVGPFIGRQLIQRLVTSNPSPQYIGRVAQAFADNGQGVRGDMKAVIRAILLDPEAHNASSNSAGAGKLREPVLRLAQWMRTFNARSASGRFLMSSLDDPLTALGQTPMRSPSVFNFYRPGYVPPNTLLSNAGLLAPELQITGETSVVGYLNFMRDVIPNGTGSGRDIKPDYSALLNLAATPDQLIDQINLLLMAGQMSTTLRSTILNAINSVTLPPTPGSALDTAKNNRVYLGVFLTMASPEYLVQK